ncbi:hypothetical protein GGI12_000622 [Dipsacomyces acuminosporus]|nr:hypothetical protein GGI12_000622 [Dipsacomyces acuminosporus]
MSFLDTSPSPNKPLPKEPLLAHDESEQAAEKTPKSRRGSQRPKDDVKDTAAAPSSQVPTPTTPKSPSRSKAAASMYSAKSSRRTRTSSLTVVDDAVDNNSDEHAVDDRDESRRLKRASKSTADESKSKRRRSLKDKTAISEQTVSSLSSSPLAGKDEDADQPVRLQLLTTGLTEAQATRLRRAVKRAGTQLSWSVNVHSDPGFLRNAAQYAKNTGKNEGSTYSHLVTVPGKDNRTARTFKYLAGLVSGAWVVSMDWILESIKARRLLPETDFTIDGDTALSQYTLTGPRQIGHLFNGYAIYVRGKLEVGSAYTSADVVNLIRATGALVVPRLEAEDDENSSPKTKSATRQQKQPRQQQWPGKKKRGADKKLSNLRDAHRRLFEIPVSTETTVVLIDIDSLSAEKAKEELDEIVEVTGGACPCRTKTWFFDCISANEVLP